MTPITCYVYRGRSKSDTYLFVPGKDAFEEVPEAVLRHLGSLELVLEFELTPNRPMARDNAREVYDNLTGRGFHIQLPDDRAPTDELLAHH